MTTTRTAISTAPAADRAAGGTTTAGERGAAARPAGFFRDVATVAGRAVRSALRAPEEIVPAIITPLFFFAVFTGALEDVSSFTGIEDYRAFQLPVAIITAVTGVSRAATVVTDIRSGYLDRLLISPVNRTALLLGMMIADLLLVVALSIPVVTLGFVVGVDFATGPLGVLAFVGIAALWGLAYAGLPYTLALRTGSAAAVGSSFLLFFPFAFLTTTFLPEEQLTGWLATVADYNPVTYLLAGLRALVIDGWVAADLAGALAAIAAVGAVSLVLAFAALRARVRRS